MNVIHNGVLVYVNSYNRISILLLFQKILLESLMKLQRNNLIWLHKGFGTIVRKFSNLSFLVWIFLFFLLLVEIVNRQIAIFADFQYCISADIVDGFEKIQRRTGISFSKARNIRRTCYVQKLFWMSKQNKKKNHDGMDSRKTLEIFLGYDINHLSISPSISH